MRHVGKPQGSTARDSSETAIVSRSPCPTSLNENRPTRHDSGGSRWIWYVYVGSVLDFRGRPQKQETRPPAFPQVTGCFLLVGHRGRACYWVCSAVAGSPVATSPTSWRSSSGVMICDHALRHAGRSNGWPKNISSLMILPSRNVRMLTLNHSPASGFWRLQRREGSGVSRQRHTLSRQPPRCPRTQSPLAFGR